MTLRLSPGISFCRTGDGLVFLDLRRDRYFQLAPHESAIFERFLRGAATEKELARFVAADLLRRTAGDLACAPVAASIAADDIHGLDPVPPSLGGALEAGYHLLGARRAVSAPRLASTIAVLSRRKAKACRGGEAVTLAARRFEANRSAVPIGRRCLVDSVALMRILLARGLAADLIFGVRTSPFAAHCWLQTGDHVLSCAQDEARNFTPILVI